MRAGWCQNGFRTGLIGSEGVLRSQVYRTFVRMCSGFRIGWICVGAGLQGAEQSGFKDQNMFTMNSIRFIKGLNWVLRFGRVT